MRWSKLKKLVEDRFAPSIAKRFALHSTVYGNCTCGHAWLTLDGDVIANFCTRAYYNREWEESSAGTVFVPDDTIQRTYEGQAVDYGEFGRRDVYSACWDFIHELSFDDALASDNPLILALAVLDQRLGKRRISKVYEGAQHPMVKRLLEVRMEAEEIPVRAVGV